MKAIVYTEYGSPDVLRLEEVDQPVPAAGEVLIRVRASSLNAADRYLMRGEPFLLRLSSGLRRPKNPRLGGDVAGVVEATGRDVRDFRPGDAVYADVSGSGLGGFGEYVAVPEHLVAPKPENLSFEAAAAVPLAGVTALQGVRDAGRVGPGQQVLIHGASGGVGTFALQIARALGAEVTAVVSPRNVELTRSLGADHVIDYTREDFSRNGRRYDAIIAANGRRSLADYRRALVDGGLVVEAVGHGHAQAAPGDVQVDGLVQAARVLGVVLDQHVAPGDAEVRRAVLHVGGHVGGAHDDQAQAGIARG